MPTSYRYPYLPVNLQVGSYQTDTEAQIDTGFEGCLAVPESLAALMEPASDVAVWELADGSRIITDQYRGAIQIGPHLNVPVADIVCTGNEFLVGREIVDRLCLILDRGHQLIVDD